MCIEDADFRIVVAPAGGAIEGGRQFECERVLRRRHLFQVPDRNFACLGDGQVALLCDVGNRLPESLVGEYIAVQNSRYLVACPADRPLGSIQRDKCLTDNESRQAALSAGRTGVEDMPFAQITQVGSVSRDKGQPLRSVLREPAAPHGARSDQPPEKEILQ